MEAKDIDLLKECEYLLAQNPVRLCCFEHENFEFDDLGRPLRYPNGSLKMIPECTIKHLGCPHFLTIGSPALNTILRVIRLLFSFSSDKQLWETFASTLQQYDDAIRLKRCQFDSVNNLHVPAMTGDALIQYRAELLAALTPLYTQIEDTRTRLLAVICERLEGINSSATLSRCAE